MRWIEQNHTKALIHLKDLAWTKYNLLKNKINFIHFCAWSRPNWRICFHHTFGSWEYLFLTADTSSLVFLGTCVFTRRTWSPDRSDTGDILPDLKIHSVFIRIWKSWLNFYNRPFHGGSRKWHCTVNHISSNLLYSLSHIRLFILLVLSFN